MECGFQMFYLSEIVVEGKVVMTGCRNLGGRGFVWEVNSVTPSAAKCDKDGAGSRLLK